MPRHEEVASNSTRACGKKMRNLEMGILEMGFENEFKFQIVLLTWGELLITWRNLGAIWKGEKEIDDGESTGEEWPGESSNLPGPTSVYLLGPTFVAFWILEIDDGENTGAEWPGESSNLPGPTSVYLLGPTFVCFFGYCSTTSSIIKNKFGDGNVMCPLISSRAELEDFQKLQIEVASEPQKRYQQNPLSEEEKMGRNSKAHARENGYYGKKFLECPSEKTFETRPTSFSQEPSWDRFGPTSVPDASSIPAPVSASLEPSKGDQVVEIVEDTPADQYSECFLQELLRDQEPSNCFMENIFTASPDADGSQNI
ncbi:hypothetical protein CK203_045957 [Vitis vinifera]|uniref:Uncharacterized protein n=1 Tax=Vitis vinifera TaxID=29760 RepID=A0A438I4W6_VITVI|nr:hypothetical protein CK203_045957 [Vitis vinifera]